MDDDPIVLAAVHSSAKELLTASMFREQSEAGLRHSRSALLALAWVTTAVKSPCHALRLPRSILDTILGSYSCMAVRCSHGSTTVVVVAAKPGSSTLAQRQRKQGIGQWESEIGWRAVEEAERPGITCHKTPAAYLVTPLFKTSWEMEEILRQRKKIRWLLLQSPFKSQSQPWRKPSCTC